MHSKVWFLDLCFITSVYLPVQKYAVHLQEENTLHLLKGFPVMVNTITHMMWFGKERSWVSHNKGVIFQTVSGAGNSCSVGGRGWNCRDCVTTGGVWDDAAEEWCCSRAGLTSATPPVFDGKGLYLKPYWIFPHFRCCGTDTRVFSLNIGVCQIQFITQRDSLYKSFCWSENCLDKKLPPPLPSLESFYLLQPFTAVCAQQKDKSSLEKHQNCNCYFLFGNSG